MSGRSTRLWHIDLVIEASSWGEAWELVEPLVGELRALAADRYPEVAIKQAGERAGDRLPRAGAEGRS